MVDLGSNWPTVVGEEQVMGVILAFAMGAGAGTSPPQNHVGGWGIVWSPYV
jgi:hypothetical protein